MSARLRQVALVVEDLGAAVDLLQERLGLGEAFADPGVAEFGLRNAVFTVGDCFVEVVAPAVTGTAAGRHRDRLGGDGGYMVLIQVDDTAAARQRAADHGIRVVWSIDLPDISGTHFHPADLGGCLLSLDSATPPGSWRWAGPRWAERRGPGRVTGLVAAVIGCRDPEAVAARWGALVGVGPEPAGRGWRLALDRSEIVFAAVASGPDRLAGFTLGVAGPDGSGSGPSPVGGRVLGCEVSFVPGGPPGR